MQYQTIVTISKFSLLLAFAVIITSAQKIDAATYFIDPTGQGCNASCQQLLNQYFSSLGNSNTNTSTSSNGASASSTISSNTATSSSSVSSSTGGTGTGNGFNGGFINNYPQYQYQYASNPNNTAVNGTGYVQYPYMTYSYFTSPKPSTNTSAYTYTSYPSSMYVYYGKDVNTQIQQYKQSVGMTNPYTGYGSTGYQYATSGYGNVNQYGASNSGFTLTSGY